MKSRFLIVLFSLPLVAHAGTYEDCVLSRIKGVSGDTAARLVARACQVEAKEQRDRKILAVGSSVAASNVELHANSVRQEGTGLLSVEVENRLSDRSVTYLRLDVAEGGEFVDPRSWGANFPSLVDKYDRAYRNSYHYLLTLPAREKIRILYPSPEVAGCQIRIGMVLARPESFRDKLSMSQITGKVRSEDKDPFD